MDFDEVNMEDKTALETQNEIAYQDYVYASRKIGKDKTVSHYYALKQKDESTFKNLAPEMKYRLSQRDPNWRIKRNQEAAEAHSVRD